MRHREHVRQKSTPCCGNFIAERPPSYGPPALHATQSSGRGPAPPRPTDPILLGGDSKEGCAVLAPLANGPALLATAIAPTTSTLRELLDEAHALACYWPEVRAPVGRGSRHREPRLSAHPDPPGTSGRSTACSHPRGSRAAVASSAPPARPLQPDRTRTRVLGYLGMTIP
jgi:hypothetical protein